MTQPNSMSAAELAAAVAADPMTNLLGQVCRELLALKDRVAAQEKALAELAEQVDGLGMEALVHDTEGHVWILRRGTRCPDCGDVVLPHECWRALKKRADQEAALAAQVPGLKEEERPK